jgi:hypothetical protein
MRKNYRQVRKQREQAKKVRQEEKQQRRTARLSVTSPAEATAAPEGDAVAAPDPILNGAS